MSSVVEQDNVQSIITDLDNLIGEMLQVRRRVATLTGSNQPQPTHRPTREAEWFGMWADREDMQGISSREWLTHARLQQWGQ